MKLTYLKPTTDMLYISVEQLLTGSPVSPEGNKDLNNAAETEETSGNLTRRKDIWADEEEEEDQY